jgi:hypothetical protein
MNRYVFRGLREDNNAWVFGDLRTGDSGCFIGDEIGLLIKVKEWTVSIWTGLWDKNNKRVFAGDIIECTNKGGTIKYRGTVLEDFGGWDCEVEQGESDSRFPIRKDLRSCYDIVVVGNIHERGENGD